MSGDRFTAATLAVGTEVTDGQIIDRNSAWLSNKLSQLGIQVVEHRAVADDRAAISRALKELASQVDLLFVTGGLGPTSDDFTRDLIAEVFSAPLVYDEASWKHIEERFKKRGREPREIQKQQCYFPKGARILHNAAGTANAFNLKVGQVQVYVLPGPPREVATVWDAHLAKEVDALVPMSEREQLQIFRTTGAGESEIAEKVEPLVRELVKKGAIRVGYRAHAPYVEVKIWLRKGSSDEMLKNVEESLRSWLAPETSLSVRFPHTGRFKSEAYDLSAREVLDLVAPYLTAERQERIRATVEGRTCNVVPVLENIYDRGNISAVLRSAEAFGYQCAHVIEPGEKFKSANRVTQGADKWLDVTKWKSTIECTRELKRQGFQILATHLDPNAKPIGEIDFSKPTAIVLGNEKDGISKEMIEECDQTVIIPMQGFVQSFNISVAAAVSLYHIYLERIRHFGKQGDLSENEKEILRAEFSVRSSKNPERLLEEILARKN